MKGRVSMNSEVVKWDKKALKKTAEELREYLQFKRRGSYVQGKKGKGAYRRKPKHVKSYIDEGK
jgi:stalled ribosome alternative rescue factor ArfA